MAKTKVELQNYQGESLSPITIASNVLYEDGRNAQEVFEEYSNETFTPTIENSSSMFKVGQGDSVDYSDNIVNGAYESMVLKGKSMVNCIQEPSSQDVVLPYEFADGRYVTINDTKESGALGVELKGQTLVNLATKTRAMGLQPQFDGDTITITSTTDGAWYSTTLRTVGMKAGGTYLLYTDSITYDDSLSSSPNLKSIVALYEMIPNRNLGGFVSNGAIKVTIPSDVDGSDIGLRIHATLQEGTEGTGKTTTVKGLKIIEYQEGMENWDIPYFEGMTSCKMPILRTVGKNLLDRQTLKQGYINENGEFQPNSSDWASDYIKILPNTKYTYKVFTNINYGMRFSFFNESKSMIYRTNVISVSNGGYATYESPSNAHYVRVHSNNFNNIGFDTDISLVMGDTPLTSYESYKTSILSLPEEVVLRSLPNGVCDTFNTRTGECVKRIGEIVFDGSQNKANWGTANYENENFIQFYWADTLVAKNNSGDGIKVNCDRFPVYSPNSLISPNPQKIGVSSRRNNSQGIVFSLTKTDMPSFSGESVNSYFAQNPITIQYELTEPIITKINLSSTLKSWNTTTHIYSEIPENTLYPILTHSNPTYPVILKPSTKYSIVANSYSNSHTNSPINFNLGGATATTTVGNRVTTITTPSTLSNELLTMSGRGNKLNNVMVIEGDVVGDEPYFKGICDCKSPILSNVGKNLLPTELSRSFKHITGNQVVSSIDLTSFLNRGVQYVIKLAIPKNVKIAKHYSSNSADDESVLVSHGAINSNNTIARFTIPSNSNSYYLFVNESGQSSSDYISDISELVTIELDTGNISTEIKPYKSNITTFDQKDDKTIVLRSLPNGVCDTLNVETGEYVQRIGEITLNGSETNWSVTNQAGWESTPNTIVFGQYFTPRAKAYNAGEISSVICDKFATITANGTWAADKEGVSINQNSRFDIRIERTKLPDESLTGFKQYLQQNPITVQYQLATPIVSTVDIQGFPYAYTNGHVQLSSGHNGQSLTPKVEYSVATNRNGQIRSNQKMVERHQKQLDQLQAIILANMVNTQYQQTLTTLNYDLLKKEVGE